MKKSGGNKKKKAFSFESFNSVFVVILTIVIFSISGFVTSQSAVVNFEKKYDGNERIKGKERIDNPDGTYTLSLSVTGGSSVTSMSSPANIILVYDISASMKTQTYVMVESDTGRRGRVNGSFVLLYRDSNCNSLSWDGDTTSTMYYKDSNNTCKSYSGKRYMSKDSKRGIEAETVVKEFAENLFAYNTEASPDAVEMALVTFSSNASTVSFTDENGNSTNWTNNKNDIVPKFTNPGNTFSDYFRSRYAGETNWQAALNKVMVLLAEADNDPTYVVFITDGTPTRAEMGYTPGPYAVVDYSDSALEEAYNVNHYDTVTDTVVSPTDTTKKSNTTLFGITVSKKTGNAVVRNKLKRQVRSIIDENKLNIAYRPMIEKIDFNSLLTFSTLTKEEQASYNVWLKEFGR